MGRNARRIIRGSLSKSGIDHIIDELTNYQRSLKDASDLFVRRLAEVGYDTAQIHIAEATATADDDKPIGTLEYISDTNGYISSMRLQFSGQQVLFVEFGAGFYYNTKENPWESKYGMGVGTFPHQTHANDEHGWSYYGEDDRWHHTMGTEATMPMFNASQAIRDRKRVLAIAKEVFGGVI